LIIDDASPDDSAEVARQLGRENERVEVIVHDVNRKHIATYNEGLAWASSDYVLLLSADDYLLPGALERAAAVLDAHPDVGFVFGRVMERNADGTLRSSEPLPGVRESSDIAIVSGLRFLQLSGARNLVPTPTAVVRNVLQQKVGGYRHDLPHTGDMEMWFRLAAHGSVAVLGAHQAVYRRHEANMSHAYYHSRRLPDLQQRSAAIEAFVDSAGRRLPDIDRLHRHMRRMLARDAIGYASSAFNDGDEALSRQLAECAKELSPTVRVTTPWLKFACKRLMGASTWRTVQPAVSRWASQRRGTQR
jgi:hypothetical protein